MRLIDIEDVALLKTVTDGGLSAKKLWRRINNQPTVDAVPVRHGKWIKGSETKRVKENRYGVLFDAYYCSACESEAYWDSDYGQILFHYCPNCGARMDGE